jgi:hypothetical protein
MRPFVVCRDHRQRRVLVREVVMKFRGWTTPKKKKEDVIGLAILKRRSDAASYVTWAGRLALEKKGWELVLVASPGCDTNTRVRVA